ncbi:class I SAM-dependent DNA methyltransferase [Desertibacillus haloalkaliphilus]|uniref:class I SAM-dependent DNA methyltransferase n=1 Tax=Desertibacillus haloalkaliphilus TaxID=1328930 RepID=UPI001C273B97|nr:class I SAM-dependent methyltransferase [Desertibacillus haloalkaliphilus]MBU8905615.1 class I SAM-dependent methyltransferase [Desertibacillus haloalkaliphilus]
MSYQAFAYLYDQLMSEAPYDEWLRYTYKVDSAYGNSGKRVLDVGCGTGAVTTLLAKQGYDVTGVDLSEDMLTVAQEKVGEAGLSVPFYQQDMKNLEGIGPFDMIVAFCDSLNYLHTEEDVQQTFASFYDHLNDGGLLLFDVHSLFKVNERFIGATFADHDEHISYIWKSFQGDYPNSVEHELSFFVEDDSGRYERFDELHVQRTYAESVYRHWLESTGFTVVKVTGDFNDEFVSSTTERLFFAAKK